MNQQTPLYHASHDKDISELQPRSEHPRFDGEEELVFATPYPALAAMFLVPKGIDVEISKYGEKYVVFINSTETEYASKDAGGAIYTLPSATFETDTKCGMGDAEYTSMAPVQPISKVVFKTSIEAMKLYGVEWYFVDEAVMRQIRTDLANVLSAVK